MTPSPSDSARHVAVLEEMLELGTPPCCFALDDDERAALEAAIRALRQGGEAWIPVSERLPEMDRPVWLVDATGHVWIGARGDTGDGWLWGNAYDSLYRDVAGNIDSSDNEADDDYQPTHWHELPGNVPAPPAQTEDTP